MMMRWKNWTLFLLWTVGLGSLMMTPTGDGTSSPSNKNTALMACTATAMVYMATLLVLQIVLGPFYDAHRNALETTGQLVVLGAWVFCQHQAHPGKHDKFYEGLFHMLQIPFLDLPFSSSLLGLVTLGPLYVVMDWQALQAAGLALTSWGFLLRCTGYFLGWCYGLGVMHTLVLGNLTQAPPKAQQAGAPPTVWSRLRRVPATLEGWLHSIGQAVGPQERELCTAILLSAPLLSCILGRFRRAYQDPEQEHNVSEMFVALICAYVLGSIQFGSVTSAMLQRLQVSQELLCDLLPSHVVRSLLDSHTRSKHPSMHGNDSHNHMEELGSGSLEAMLLMTSCEGKPYGSNPGSRKISFGINDGVSMDVALGGGNLPGHVSDGGTTDWQRKREASLGGGRKNRSLCSPLSVGSGSNSALLPRLTRRKTFVLTDEGSASTVGGTWPVEQVSAPGTASTPSRLHASKSNPCVDLRCTSPRPIGTHSMLDAQVAKAYSDSKYSKANQSMASDRSSLTSVNGEVIKAFQACTDKEMTPLNIWTAKGFPFGDSACGPAPRAETLGLSSVQGTKDTTAARASVHRDAVMSEPLGYGFSNLEEALYPENLRSRMIQSLDQSNSGNKREASDGADHDLADAEDEGSVDEPSVEGFTMSLFKTAARRISMDVTHLMSSTASSIKKMHQKYLMDSIDSLPEETLEEMASSNAYADCHLLNDEPSQDSWSAQPSPNVRRTVSSDAPVVSPRIQLLSGRKTGSNGSTATIASELRDHRISSSFHPSAPLPEPLVSRTSGSFSFRDASPRGHPRPATSSIDNMSVAEWHEGITIIFADVVGFTAMAQQVHPQLVMRMLNEMYVRFDDICLASEDKVYKVETIGDCYMCATGLLKPDANHAQTALEFAVALREAASQVQLPTTSEPVLIRIGIHSGRAMSGIVGKLRRRYCLFGDTVNTASRMESLGAPGCIHISNDTFQHVQHLTHLFEFKCRGKSPVKGKGLMTTWWVDHVGADHVGPEEQPGGPAMALLNNLSAKLASQDTEGLTSYESLLSDPWWEGLGCSSGLIMTAPMSNQDSGATSNSYGSRKPDVFSMSSLYSSGSSKSSKLKAQCVEAMMEQDRNATGERDSGQHSGSLMLHRL